MINDFDDASKKKHTDMVLLRLPDDLTEVGVKSKYNRFMLFAGHFRHKRASL